MKWIWNIGVTLFSVTCGTALSLNVAHPHHHHHKRPHHLKRPHRHHRHPHHPHHHHRHQFEQEHHHRHPHHLHHPHHPHHPHHHRHPHNQLTLAADRDQKRLTRTHKNISGVELTDPKDVVIYVISGDNRPQGKCSAATWVSDAIDFGFRVVYYGHVAEHKTSKGQLLVTRNVEDNGVLEGQRGHAWTQYASNILKDLLNYAPDAKFYMRTDDDTYVHPWNLWKALKALPLHEKKEWMIGDCGGITEHGDGTQWCGGGSGILISHDLAQKLPAKLEGGACGANADQDDDALGKCSQELGHPMTNHHGFHWWPPAIDKADVNVKMGECPAEQLGKFVVVQDWISYHHMSCDNQYEINKAIHGKETLMNAPRCAGDLGGGFNSIASGGRCAALPDDHARSQLCRYNP